MLETSPELQASETIQKLLSWREHVSGEIYHYRKKEYLQVGKNDESEEDCTRRKKKTCIVRGEECGGSEGKKNLTIPL